MTVQPEPQAPVPDASRRGGDVRPDPSTFCPRDHGCSLPAGHDDDCELTAAVCDCAECEARAAEPVGMAAAGEAVEATMVGFDTTSDGRLLLEFQVPQDTRAKLSSRWLLTRAPEEAVPTAREGDCDAEDYCHRCGRPNICWHAPNDTWNAGVGTPEDTRGNTLILCPVCFVQQYEQRHGEPIWTLTAREGGEAEVSSPVRVDGETWVEYSIVRDSDGYRYPPSHRYPPSLTGYPRTAPEPIMGGDHVEQREVSVTAWCRAGASS